MWTKSISICLSVLLLLQIGCTSFQSRQKQFQIDSQTFTQGEWIVVVFTDKNGDLIIEKGRLERITKVEVILQGLPPKRIALDQVKRIDKYAGEGSQSDTKTTLNITPKKGLILTGLFIGTLFMIYVIFPPQFDFVGKNGVFELRKTMSERFPREIATPQKGEKRENQGLHN
jgi:hypothetical protein